MANVVVIGGGVAGLSAGIYSLLDGHRVTVCEKHSTAGGNLTGWQRGEYHIDNCIHWLTGTNPATETYKMWEQLGALGDGVETVKNGTLYTCELGGRRISLSRDIRILERDMLSISPEDKDEIKSFIRAIEAMMLLCGIGGKNNDERASARQITSRGALLFKYYAMSTGQLAARFKSRHLKYFISAMMGDGFGAIALIAVFATFCGQNGDLPRGGSVGMAQRMTVRLKKLGGELLTGAAVTRVNREGGKAHSVSLADGRELDADYVVITADPAAVFGKLIDAPMPRRLQKQYSSDRFVRFSSYHCAFACDAKSVPFKSDIMFPIPERYRRVLRTDSLTVREFSHEPSFAPCGKNIIQSMTFCSEADARAFIKLRAEDREAYKRKKQRIAMAVEELLISHFPEMEASLECLDVWTPATYRRFTASEMGSYMSFAMPPLYIPRRMSNSVAGLSNVLLATQWQQLPGGLPIAAEVGRDAALSIAVLEKRRAKDEIGVTASPISP